MKNTLFLLAGLVMANSIYAQKLSTGKLSRAVKKTTAFKGAKVGIMAITAADQKPKAALNEKDFFIPASNTKILTLLAALKTFDSLPALTYVKTKEATHFTTTAYPLLLHPKYSDSTLFDFLKKQKRLIYHPPGSVPVPLGSGWAWDDQQYYFSAEKSAFPIFGNVIRFTRDSKSSKITHFPSVGIPPKTPFFPLKENSYNLTSQFQKLASRDTLLIPFPVQKAGFVSLLSHALDKKVAIDSMSMPSNPDTRQLFSPEAKKLYPAMMFQSDNLIAESLLLMVGKEKLNTLSIPQTIAYLKERGGAPFNAKMQWVDGSGLSRYNLLSPEILVQALGGISQISGWGQLKTLFPSLGKGTLEANFKGLGIPELYAKTGTLKNNFSLSGYLTTKKGNQCIFSIMINNHMSSNDQIREATADLLVWFWKKL